MKSNYSIIISIYNEKASIPSLLEHLYFYYTKGHEIIIIDDGSNDGSNKILCKSNFVNFIKFKHNKGKGIAIKEGIQKATNEKIIIFDGDLEINPDQIQELMILDHKKKLGAFWQIDLNGKKLFQFGTLEIKFSHLYSITYIVRMLRMLYVVQKHFSNLILI